MRIIDAEPELIEEILEEIEVVESRDNESFSVHIGHHPTLGRIALVRAKEGQGAIIEMEYE